MSKCTKNVALSLKSVWRFCVQFSGFVEEIFCYMLRYSLSYILVVIRDGTLLHTCNSSRNRNKKSCRV